MMMTTATIGKAGGKLSIRSFQVKPLTGGPIFLKKTHFTHHSFEDPSKVIGKELEIEKAFLKCRNEIKKFSEQYLKKYF